MRVVFVTRKFPPSVGGMETLAADIWASLGARDERTRLIAHGGSNALLPFFLLVAAVRVTALVLRRAVDVVLVGDVVLYMLLAPLLRLLRVRHATMAMGKDVVWSSTAYQTLMRASLRRVPHVIAISNSTAEAVALAGVEAGRIDVIRLGVDAPAVSTADRAEARAELRDRFDLADDAAVLLALGRLVPRKGVAWFVRHVLPALPPSVALLVAGAGDDAAAIRSAVAESGQAWRTMLLGLVTNEERETLMCGADIFVQPNIPVAGDLEGFGLVAVEAAVRGACVVAADLEGLRDAISDSRTGILLPAQDSGAWIDGITRLVDDRTLLADVAQQFRREASARYSREAMGEALLASLQAARN